MKFKVLYLVTRYLNDWDMTSGQPLEVEVEAEDEQRAQDAAFSLAHEMLTAEEIASYNFSFHSVASVEPTPP